MRILRFKCAFSILFISILFTYKSNAQSSVTVNQDEQFSELLAAKRKINASITVNDKYKVQIFYGDNNGARKSLQDFRRDYKNVDATIIYESPTYKVLVGSYKSKIEAERNLAEIRKKFPYALIVRPNK
ncbi:SPOR domain-containing protein [Flavobacterium sp. RHBU_24]|uniref:SPOR domain-containing protein n=1 Tax=Flavobacterium sp. RHBU_24 TaxID=3391185 RepID=UPI0039847714